MGNSAGGVGLGDLVSMVYTGGTHITRATKILAAMKETKSIERNEIHLETEGAIKLFKFLRPYIEEAGYTVELHTPMGEAGIDVIIDK